MKQSYSLNAALEEFHDAVQETISADPVVLNEETISPAAVEEGAVIASDMDQFAETVQALEDIVALVEDTPEEAETIMPEATRGLVNYALESVDDGVKAAEGDTKGGVVEKIKERAKKIVEKLVEMAGKVAAWFKGKFAAVVSGAQRNIQRAKGLGARLKAKLPSKAGAKITGQVASVAYTTDGTLIDAARRISEHFDRVVGKDGVEAVKNLGFAVLDSVDGSDKSGDIDASLKKISSLYPQPFKGDLANIGAPEGGEVKTSGAFLRGYESWVAIPASSADVGKFKHGISKSGDSEDPKEQPVLDQNALLELLDLSTEISQRAITVGYVAKVVDDINGKFGQVRKYGEANQGDQGAAERITAVMTLIPKVINSPAMAMINYASTASNILIAYAEACLEVLTRPEGQQAAAAPAAS